MKLFVFITLTLMFAMAIAADRYPLVTAEQRQQLNRLTHQFRCLVCQNEDLAASNAGLAEDLRYQIYQMVQQGKTNQEITRYMVKRYGDFVLLKPKFSGNALLLWLAPFLLLLVGMVILWRIVKRSQA